MLYKACDERESDVQLNCYCQVTVSTLALMSAFNTLIGQSESNLNLIAAALNHKLFLG